MATLVPTYGQGRGARVPGVVAGTDPDAVEQAGAQLFGQRQNNQFQTQRDAAQYGYQRNLAQQQADAEMARQQQQLGFQREQLAQQGALSRAQIEASLAPTRFAQQKFNTVFPWVQGQLGNLMGGGSGGFGYKGAPLPTNRPEISDAPIYSDQQIQANVNAQRAMNDQATASKQQQIQSQMAARGYGSNSPLAAALQNSLAIGNMQTNTANEQDLRYKAAAGNAGQRLEAQKARLAQDLGYLGEETKRGIAGQQQQTALISALLGML